MLILLATRLLYPQIPTSSMELRYRLRSAAATPRVTAGSILEAVCEAAVVLMVAHQARVVAETSTKKVEAISGLAVEGEATWFNAAEELHKLLKLGLPR